MPDIPVDQEDILASLTNIPDAIRAGKTIKYKDLEIKTEKEEN